MIRWRLALVAVLIGVIAIPLLAPFWQLLNDSLAWQGWMETSRLAILSRNTLLLTLGTLALCLPAGILTAILLYRTDLPWRGLLRGLVFFSLFVPLPLFTSGWQAALGSGGWMSMDWWNAPRPNDPALNFSGIAWSPWGRGLATAIFIHALAGLPWVIWLVGLGLLWVDRDLEEDGLTAAGPWRVLRRISLPRAGAAIAAAALWIALQTVTEITVTDVMQVRTFAEEIYAQFVMPDVTETSNGLARAVAVALPLGVIAAVLILLAARRWEQSLPPNGNQTHEILLYPLGCLRWPLALTIALGALLLIGCPVGSLLWRAGLSGAPPSWSIAAVWLTLKKLYLSSAQVIGVSFFVAGMSGLLAATFALVSCWLSLDSRRFRMSLFILAALAWSMPGPIVGLGLKGAIDALLDWTGPGLLADLLWYGPSTLPVVWANVIRMFPFAVAILWPTIRLLPTELRESARIDGAGPGREFALVIAPLMAGAWLTAALATSILALGEVSAGKSVSTAGQETETWAIQVFTQMHYGVTNDLAARCLMLLAAVLVSWLLVRSVCRRVALSKRLSDPRA